MKKVISLLVTLCITASVVLTTFAEVALPENWLDAPNNPATDYAYSFALVGDTQTIVLNDIKKGTNKLSYIYDWLVANAEDKKIANVFGLGDITDTYDDDGDEWDHAKAQIDKLNGVVSYTLVRGNHDNLNHFKTYFGGESSYLAQMNGTMTEGAPANAYKTLTVGKVKYLILTLDYSPSDAVVKWASEVI